MKKLARPRLRLGAKERRASCDAGSSPHSERSVYTMCSLAIERSMIGAGFSRHRRGTRAIDYNREGYVLSGGGGIYRSLQLQKPCFFRGQFGSDRDESTRGSEF